jgi:hypothetical protein
MMRGFSFACLILLLCRSPLQAQFAWKLKQGDRFFVEETTSIRQTIKITGTETRQDLDQTKVLRYIVLGRNADGDLVLEKQIESVKLVVGVGGASPESKLMQQFEGASFLLTLDPKGRIVKLDGWEELVAKLAQKTPETAKLIRALVSEEVLKTTDEHLFHFLPQSAPEKGSWQNSASMSLGPLGRLDALHRYQPAKEQPSDKSMTKISVASKLTYALPKENSDYPIKVVRGFLKPERAEGTILFDTARGRLVQSEYRRVLDGALHISVPSGAVDMDLKQEQTVTLRLLDK